MPDIVFFTLAFKQKSMVQLCTFAQAWGPQKKQATVPEIVLQPKASKSMVAPIPKAQDLPKAMPSPKPLDLSVPVPKPMATKNEEVISIHLHRQVINLFFFLHIASLVAILILIMVR
jgi:hypothetical protein